MAVCRSPEQVSRHSHDPHPESIKSALATFASSYCRYREHVVAEQSDLKALRELIKNTFARRDFKTATVIADVLLRWEAAKPGANLHDPLWNALIVSYVRPFMKSRKMGAQAWRAKDGRASTTSASKALTGR